MRYIFSSRLNRAVHPRILSRMTILASVKKFSFEFHVIILRFSLTWISPLCLIFSFQCVFKRRLNHMKLFVQSIDFFVQTYTIFISRKGDGLWLALPQTSASVAYGSDLKAQADALFGELGMNLSTTFNIFVRQSLREGRIPFDILSESAPTKKRFCCHVGSRKDCKGSGP